MIEIERYSSHQNIGKYTELPPVDLSLSKDEILSKKNIFIPAPILEEFKKTDYHEYIDKYEKYLEE